MIYNLHMRILIFEIELKSSLSVVTGGVRCLLGM